MKKRLLLLCLLSLAFGSGRVLAGVSITDQYKFEFNNLWTSTIPSSPAVTSSSGTVTGTSVFGVGSGSITLGATNVALGGSGSGNRGGYVTNLNGGTTLSTSKKEVIELDWFVNSSTGDAMNYNAIVFSDASKNAVFMLASESWTASASGVHFMNLTPSTTYLTATTYLLAAATYTGTSDYKTDCKNFFAGSYIGVDFPNNKTYHIKAKMDFNTHMIDSLWITRSDDATKVYIATGVAFLSNTAASLDRISFVGTRGKNQTNSANGGNAVVNMTLDNYSVYTWENVPTANVHVNYIDADDSSPITSVIRTNKTISSVYSVGDADKASFDYGGDHCVYSSTTVDNATVLADNSAYVEIMVKRFPVTAGTYNWTGASNGNFSELDANFTTDELNVLGYQVGNAVLFPATASNKTITLNNNTSFGSSDLTISGDGYNLSGTGIMTGTGKIIVNLSGAQTATLNLNNALTGTGVISGGLVTLSKTGTIGSNLNVTGASTLLPANNVTLPNTTFTASTTIDCGTNYSYINGISMGSGIKTTISSGLNTAGSTYAFGIATSGTMAAGSELELIGTGTENKFGLSSASSNYLANTKVTLKGNSFLFVNVNQGAVTTMNIGTLAGETGSKLGWGTSTALDRTITWSVGASNASSEYAGVITNAGGYSAGNIVGNFTPLIKEGTGTLTLSAIDTTHNGNYTINNGAINVTGGICKSTSTVSVAAAGKLTGTGIVGGSATISGTLEGSLRFGNGLTLSGTTKINIANFAAGAHDSIVVAGVLVKGGTLAITIPATAPAVNDSIRLISAASQSGTFTTVTFPTGYSYNQTNGYLKYTGKAVHKTSGWDGGSAPASGMDAELQSGTLSIDANTTLGHIVMKPGSGLTTSVGNTLTTTSLILESDATGTATLIDNGTVTGTISVKQYFTGTNNAGTPNGRFWYVTSPISNATTAGFAPSTGNKLWSHSEADGYAAITTDDVTLEPGKGYVARMKENTTVTFTGTPNTGDKTIPITRTGTSNFYRGFNLVGNPYPSFAELKAEDNVEIEQSIWYRSLISGGSSMVFDTYNFNSGAQVVNSGNGALTANIPPLQAFWVKTHTAGTSNVVFKQVNRTHQTSVKLRSAEADTTPRIRLQITNGKCKDQAFIGLYPNATDAFDKFDSHKMSNGIDSFPEIYTMNGNEELAINGLKHDGRTKTLALGFRTGKKGNFKLKVIEMKNLGDSVRVILKDKVKNCDKVLTDSAEYDFTSDVATTTDRFALVITANAPTALNDLSTSNADAFSTSDNQIQVRLIGTKGSMARVKVFNTMGQEVGTFVTNAANTVLQKRFAPGIYLVNIDAEGVQTTKKVSINQ
jgi:hypothetical protein